jgi:2-polyprenyl-3-methyl-5-hydroxy-6-metoxy-1,4-benzoquinol methylase
VAESQYTSQYFDEFQDAARSSARAVVPLVLELIKPGSVCDVGCARGTWLSVFQEHGVSDVIGIDGDHVAKEELEIPAERFIAADLQKGLSLERTFDLALCLEVAEHLPEKSAGPLVDGLVGLAPAVLFSAAIPRQGGVGHVNEQWPEYWEAHFRRGGYVAVDCIRPRIWNARHVRVWYAQNLILFVANALLDALPRLKNEYEVARTRQLSIVHPRMFERASARPWILLEKLRQERDDGLISPDEYEARLAKMISRHAK